LAGHRAPRWARLLGWLVSIALWAVASDARPLLALLSVAAAVVIRCVYVVTTRLGTGRSVFWSSWFFAVAAACEVAWLIY
jgi:Na+/glutamate symporter